MAGELILIVEDNEKNLKLVRDLLLVKGYRALEADSAELGVELARHHRPRLILMDIQLPGVDGVAALSQLRADPATGTIPVVALTAFAMQDERQRFRSAGFDGYLAKPVNIRELLAVVGAFCERRAPHPDPLTEDEGAEQKPLPDRARESRGTMPEVEGAP